MFGPPVPSRGPLNARILIIGEAPGELETEKLTPFVGPSGWELRRMLKTLGANLDECYITNVFSRRPPNNSVAAFGVPRGHPDAVSTSLGPLANEPVVFLDAQWEPELARLYAELACVSPNIVIALGNTATWALGLGLGISGLRGSVYSIQVEGSPRPLKVLPTYHPAAVLREWSLRVVCVADLQKALTESLSPDLNYDNSALWIAPSLADLAEFDAQHMAGANICACDIETKRGQITCISFAPRPDISLAIPFWIEGDAPNYWSDAGEEREAWRWVIRQLERADLVKVFQNGLYDLAYLMRYCTPRSCSEDTMLLHHSLYSELQKGLGFLGSVYCNTPSWKSMRTMKREELLKKDD